MSDESFAFKVVHLSQKNRWEVVNYILEYFTEDVLENYNGWKEYERPVKNYLEVVISENSNGTYLFHSIDKPKRRIINE